MAVMQGPRALVFGLMRSDGKIDERHFFDVEVFPSPNEVIARLANGEIDVALPTNVVTNLYAKGVKVKIAAVTGQGC